MTRVLVVDDHMVIRKGIQSILRAWPEWEISGEAANGEEAVQLTKDLKPEIVLMDMSMPGMGGIEATRLIRKVHPAAKVLLFTLHDSLEFVEAALRAGARGYLLKSDTEGELVRALNVVAANGFYTSPSFDADRVKTILEDLNLAV
ncbi:MAG TPA: response regulator transcription factor [Candidatus Acidoferrum sp.]|jgi:DNA-binding NarL/FixJ family response regulator